MEKTLSRGLSADASRSCLGESLSYVDSSNWFGSLSSPNTPVSAFTEEGEEPYSMSESLGRLVCQQLQRGNVVRVCSSSSSNRSRRDEDPAATRRKAEGVCAAAAAAAAELVPLCIQDELRRRNAKIVTPRAASAYAPLPIVSETYPVLCGGEKYKHTLFGSSGFHTLDRHADPALAAAAATPPPPPQRTVRSAIVRITDSLQAEAAERKRRGRERRPFTVETWQGDVFTTTAPPPPPPPPPPATRAARLRVLSADGSVAKETAPGKATLRREKPPAFPNTAALKGRPPTGMAVGACAPLSSPLIVSPLQRGHEGSKWRRGQSGVLWKETQPNPDLNLNPDPDPGDAGHRAPDDSQCNKRIYQLISKSVQKNATHDAKRHAAAAATAATAAAKQIPPKDAARPAWQPRTFRNFVLSNVRSMQVYGVKLTRPRPNGRTAQCKYAANPPPPPPPPPPPHSSDGRQTEFTPLDRPPDEETESQCPLARRSPPFDPEHAISIPTAQQYELTES
ncbi:unnamed protein product [Merluccius merluccius]